MATDSNVNLNTQIGGGNTGTISSFPELGILNAIVLVPKGTIIPAASMVDPQTFATYVNGKFIADDPTSRWQALTNLDTFKDDTKKEAIEDTGLYQDVVYAFPAKHTFRYLRNMGNFIELTSFNNCQGTKDIFYVDTNGNWQGTRDSTGLNGLQAYSLQQLFVPNRVPRMVGSAEMYNVSIQLALQKETNDYFKCYQANYNPSAIQGLQNVIITDVSSTLGTPLSFTTTTDMIVIAKQGQDSTDFIQKYAPFLTKACFKATDLTSSTSITISSMTFGAIVVANQTYWYAWAVFSAAPTTGHKVQLTLQPPSVVNGIIPLCNSVVELLNQNVNGNGGNAAVRTF